MRSIELNRTTAEDLVDLLESCDPKKEGTWRWDLADDVRAAFGMVSNVEEFTKKLYPTPSDKVEAQARADMIALSQRSGPMFQTPPK